MINYKPRYKNYTCRMLTIERLKDSKSAACMLTRRKVHYVKYLELRREVNG